MHPGADLAVEAVLAPVRGRPALPGGGRLLCIEGPAGSGKTTLATGIVEAADVVTELLHMDDMYDGWGGLGDELGDELAHRLHDQVTGPFASGVPGFRRRYDWDRGEFAELHVVPPVDLLVIEGVGSGHRLLAGHRTTLAWVSAPDDLRVERGLARDRALYGRSDEPWDEATQRAHWQSFLADEARHFAENNLPAAADVLVDGTRARV
ncbi:MAG: 4-amino-4-deoxy-L-arabinose transferase [Nocardioides sp.]|nr:4-amino-4-deoxy-L-arabinose transferase [Nocardioides sp.]